MSRRPQPTRPELDPAALNRLGAIARSRGESGQTSSRADRELVDQVLCADWQTTAVRRTHIPDAVAVGVRIEAMLRGIRDGSRPLDDYRARNQ
jgi:hypothetical protein